MNFRSILEEGILVFSLLETKLDTGNSGTFKIELTRVMNESKSPSGLILDLSEVESCDSSGLSVLLIANRLAGNNFGSLRIISTSPKVLNLIKITRLDEVLIVTDSVETAKKQIKGL